MVFNTITNNMEKLKMKQKRTSKTTINGAITLLNKGWSAKQVANKYNVTTSAVYNWKSRHNTTNNKTVTKLSKNGVLDNIDTKLIHNLTVSFDNNFFQQLIKLAEQEVRTPQDQVKYLVHRELVRLARNNTNIPF
tara:strand:+ start:173 stop:577 length:405 start_codon:yes stop_codon:yes gene_type:complete